MRRPLTNREFGIQRGYGRANDATILPDYKPTSTVHLGWTIQSHEPKEKTCMRLTKRKKEVLEQCRQSFGQQGYDVALEHMRIRENEKARRAREHRNYRPNPEQLAELHALMDAEMSANQLTNDKPRLNVSNLPKRENTMPQTYSQFLASLSKEKRHTLTTKLQPLTITLNKQAAEGTRATVAFGETAFAIRKLLSKSGAGGQVSNYCREQKILRSTFYNNIRIYQWEKLVPAEFKAVAEKHGMSYTDAAQTAIIKLAFGATPATVAEVDEKLTELAAKTPKSKGDAIVTAINSGAKLLIAACKGELDKVTVLCGFEDGEYVEEAQAVLNLTATSLMAASQIIATSAFDEIKKLVGAHKYPNQVKLPEGATLNAAVANRVKQLTESNPPATA
jgi:hypothetical protein